MSAPYSFSLITILLITTAVLTLGDDSTPVVSLEDASIKACNLTSENRPFLILTFNLRAVYSSTNKSIACGDMDVEIRKGKHHTLADDVIPTQSQAHKDYLTMVEAVALCRRLQCKIATELRIDNDEGFARVNVYASASLGSGSSLIIECMNVMVSVDSSNRHGFEKMVCDLDIYTPPPPSDYAYNPPPSQTPTTFSGRRY